MPSRPLIHPTHGATRKDPSCCVALRDHETLRSSLEARKVEKSESRLIRRARFALILEGPHNCTTLSSDHLALCGRLTAEEFSEEEIPDYADGRRPALRLSDAPSDDDGGAADAEPSSRPAERPPVDNTIFGAVRRSEDRRGGHRSRVGPSAAAAIICFSAAASFANCFRPISALRNVM